MKKLILVRHGESEWNKLNLFTGWTDVDLSAEGIEEAKKAGRLLKAEKYSPQFCYTSYLKRAIKTLNYMLDEMNMDWLPVEKHWRLNEKHYGAIQGLNKAETAKQYGEEQVKLWRRAYNVRPPALELTAPNSPRQDERYQSLPNELIPLTESLEDTVMRAMPYYYEVIEKTFERYDQILVVAHGNSLRAIVKTLRNMTESQIIDFNIPTAVPYVFEFNDDMTLKTDYFVGDPEEILKKMECVANQGRKE